jgi:hypothetical protein
MSKKLHCFGHDWEQNHETWYTTIDRFVVNTWKFGSIHQAKILVDYDLKIDGKTHDAPLSRPYVGICLRPGKTRDVAMKTCLDWIDEFKKKGPPTVEESFEYCAKYWSDIYPTRVSYLDHWFFTIGNGYDWLDGSLMNTSPDSYLDSLARREENKEVFEAAAEVKKLLKKYGYEEILNEYDDYSDPQSKYWTSGVYSFYPVSKDYSDICKVPDDVKPDWLALAYEAALLLRDKSGVPQVKSRYSSGEDDHARQEENRKIGVQVVSDLERRFPHVLKKGQ